MTTNCSQELLSQSRPSSAKRRVLAAHGSDPFTASPRSLSAHLPMIAIQMVSLLSEQDKASFHSSWLGSKLIVGSLCSGTDVCVDALQGLARVGKFVVEHKLSCDISPANQRRILQQCSPPLMASAQKRSRYVIGHDSCGLSGLGWLAWPRSTSHREVVAPNWLRVKNMRLVIVTPNWLERLWS